MVHLILTGATGLIGSSILSHILSLPGGLVASKSQTISKLTILTRSTSIPMLSNTPPAGTPRANTATEIEVVVHNDFSHYDADVLAKLKGADACIWALGVSQNDVDRDAYVNITKEYALEGARAFSTLRNPQATDTSDAAADTAADAKKFKFIYISGEGADVSPKFYTPLFGRVKGDTELSLLALSRQPAYTHTLAAYSARPAAVDGLAQPWVWDPVMREKRTAFQRFYLRLLLPPIAWAWKSGHSPTENLARVLVEMAVDPARKAYDGTGVSGEGWTLGNVALRRLGGL